MAVTMGEGTVAYRLRMKVKALNHKDYKQPARMVKEGS
jgi:hypothetical protein